MLVICLSLACCLFDVCFGRVCLPLFVVCLICVCCVLQFDFCFELVLLSLVLAVVLIVWFVAYCVCVVCCPLLVEF